MKIADLVSKTSKSLIFKEPFYGLFLTSMNKIYGDHVQTAGVSKNGMNVQLYINSEFFSNLSDKHKIGLLKHEILHISFGHMLSRTGYADKKLFNIAADLEINQYIDPDYLPEGGITMESFPEIHLPAKMGTDWYYKKLQEEHENRTCPNLNSMLDEVGDDMHGTWDEFEDIAETDQKLIKKQIEHQIKDVAEHVEKTCGHIPGELADLIERLKHVEPAKFDWKGYLRRFVGNSSIVYTKKLRRKYNKRYSENPGLKIKFKNHICVGVDTSGSVSKNELKEFFSELTHMHKTGHKITIVQCDTEINSIKDFNPKQDWEIHGRGGTIFQPVIDHYNQFGKYTALIYFTDGEASTPHKCPKNALWVHSSTCSVNEDLPGQKIQLN